MEERKSEEKENKEAEGINKKAEEEPVVPDSAASSLRVVEEVKNLSPLSPKSSVKSGSKKSEKRVETSPKAAEKADQVQVSGSSSSSSSSALSRASSGLNEVVPFWKKRHSRYEFSAFARELVEHNPGSYHRLPLALRDSYIERDDEISGKLSTLDMKEKLDTDDLELLKLKEFFRNFSQDIFNSEHNITSPGERKEPRRLESALNPNPLQVKQKSLQVNDTRVNAINIDKDSVDEVKVDAAKMDKRRQRFNQSIQTFVPMPFLPEIQFPTVRIVSFGEIVPL